MVTQAKDERNDTFKRCFCPRTTKESDKYVFFRSRNGKHNEGEKIRDEAKKSGGIYRNCMSTKLVSFVRRNLIIIQYSPGYMLMFPRIPLERFFHPHKPCLWPRRGSSSSNLCCFVKTSIRTRFFPPQHTRPPCAEDGARRSSIMRQHLQCKMTPMWDTMELMMYLGRKEGQCKFSSIWGIPKSVLW